jgi:hypothetical protein
MPGDPSRGQSPAWRNQGGPGERKKGAQPAWRKDQEAPHKSRRLSRPTKFGIVLGLCVVLVGGLVWLLLMLWPPSSAALVVVGSGYEENLAVPHNVYGWDGAKDVAGLFTQNAISSFWDRVTGKTSVQLLKEPVRLTDPEGWAPKDWTHFGGKTLLILVALHGGTDRDGAFLWVDDPERKQRLYLKQMIDDLRPVTAQKNVVLVLDATQVDAYWPAGMLHNDFARELEKLEPEIKQQQRLVVFSASGPDQRSWVSEEWRRSIFTHYLREGLQGAAQPDRSGPLTVKQLVKYVSDKVAGWALDNRAAPQEPVLLPRDGGLERTADWTLIAGGREGHAATDPAEAPGDDYKKPAADLAAEKVWQKHDEAAGKPLRPWVYAPQAWRLYEATLLRYEQLVRAGDAEHAGHLRDGLKDLAPGETAQGLRFSRYRSLAMPLLAGKAADEPADEKVRDTFAALWDRGEKQRDAAWQQARAGTENQDALRLAVARQLVKKVTGQAPDLGDFKKAYDVVHTMDPGGNNRPVEAHLLALLGRDLKEREQFQQPLPPAQDLRMAVDVCRLAEETALSARDFPVGESQKLYAYSEWVYPWISKDLADADKARRHGEDLLFASDESNLADARKQLEEAKRAYGKIADHAVVLRRALAAYQEARAWLPSYAEYLARSDESTPKKLQDAAQLAELTDRLGDLLEQPKPEGQEAKDAGERAAAQARRLQAVKDAAEGASAELQRLQDEFKGHCEALASGPQRTQSGWHELEAVLTVPGIAADTRLRLVQNSRDVSHELNRNTAKQGGSHPAPKAHPFEEARRQGEMALAVLGRHWVQACNRREQDGEREPDFFGPLAQKIREARDGDWLALNDAGSQLGRCWELMVPKLEGAATGPEDQKAEDAVAQARQGERLARQLDGGAAYLLYEVRKRPDPVDDYRRLQLQGLLRGQAERTRLDHWWGEAKDAAPYYVVSGRSYLQDAEDLLPQQHRALTTAEGQLVAGLKKGLDRPDGLGVTTPDDHLSVTDQRGFSPDFRLEDNPRVPRGELVCWADMKGPIQEGAGEAGKRQVKAVGDPLPVYRPTWQDTTPSARQCEIILHVRYRGQVIDHPVQVTTPGAPDRVVYQYPPAPTGKIMVRADGEVYNRKAWEQMRIAIVFDHSLSMEVDDDGKPSNKLTEATEALEEVLRNLPPGPKVSLWTFGHRDLDRYTEPAERLAKPQRWEANADRAAQLKTELRNIRGDGKAASPIVHTMVKAAEDDLGLRKEDAREKEDASADVGVKVLLVLTDGDDNVFRSTKETYNPGGRLTVPDYLRKRFDDTDVQILMVGFQLGKEEESATAQFSVLTKLRQPGSFLAANNKAGLRRILARYLEQQDLHCRVYRDQDNRLIKLSRDLDPGLLVSRPDQDLIPSEPLAPDAYVARVPATRPLHFRLDRGDLLLLDVQEDGLRRALFKDYHERVSNRKLPSGRDDRGWVVTAHESKVGLNRHSLQMLLSAEKDAGRDEDNLRLIKPEFVWFDLAADGGKGEPKGLSWGNVGDVVGYPAPTWRLDVGDWPEGALPRVRAWVRDRPPSRESDLSEPFPHARNAPLDKFYRSEARIGNDRVQRIRVTFEDIDVRVRPGEKAVKKPCLVVRAQYDKGSPVMAHLEGLGHEGAEHRFYSGVNQYTGIFWPVDPDVARQADFTLSLISLRAVLSEPAIEFPVREREVPAPQRIDLERFEAKDAR